MTRPRTATCGACGRRGQVVGRQRGWLFRLPSGSLMRTPAMTWWAHVSPYDDDDHSFQPPRFPRTLSARGPAVRTRLDLKAAELNYRRLFRDYRRRYITGIGWAE